MIYKKCSTDDVIQFLPAFADLFADVYGKNFPYTHFSGELWREKALQMQCYVEDGSAIVYAAFEGETLAGFIWGYARAVFEEKRMHIPILVVKSQHRRKGIAKELMGMMRHYCEDENIEIIELMVTGTNKEALAYYASEGFKESRKLLELRVTNDEN